MSPPCSTWITANALRRSCRNRPASRPPVRGSACPRRRSRGWRRTLSGVAAALGPSLPGHQRARHRPGVPGRRARRPGAAVPVRGRVRLRPERSRRTVRPAQRAVLTHGRPVPGPPAGRRGGRRTDRVRRAARLHPGQRGRGRGLYPAGHRRTDRAPAAGRGRGEHGRHHHPLRAGAHGAGTRAARQLACCSSSAPAIRPGFRRWTARRAVCSIPSAGSATCSARRWIPRCAAAVSSRR